MLPFLFNDLTLQILNFLIDSLASSGFPFNFLNQLLDLLLLDICGFLHNCLLLHLLGHLHLLHLKLFQQFVIFHFELTNFLILLSELGLE